VESLSDDLMWNTVITCNPKYDGKFFYAVKTTQIFCRPSCKSKTPIRKNVVYFKTPTEAIGQGFRACKRCRPDLMEYDIADSIISSAKAIIENEHQNEINLEKLSSNVGVSPFHLQRLFTKKVGYSPRDYLQKIRVGKAKELLIDSSLNNTDVCYVVGFQSLSSFYAVFRKHIGVSPKQFRQQIFKKRGAE
jgi:AraC family transcriptional regulator of adaptative response / methylphosphotriester-DNA alkyltransferase methyltransferase